LGERTFGRFPYPEITAGNRLEKTVELALYGTFEHGDDDD
jgi:hypothetical protein